MPSTTLSQGLVGYWTFDNTLADQSGNGNTGTGVGSPTYTTGKIGQALSVTPSTYVNVSHSPLTANLGPMTISTWVNPQVGNTSNDFTIAKYAGVGVYRWSLAYDVKYSGTVTFTYQYGSASLVVKTSNNAIPLADKKWHLVTISWDGSQTAANAHVYIDGVEATYQTQRNGSGTHTDDTLNDLHINQGATALLDDLRL